jgi:hypothetical protein
MLNVIMLSVIMLNVVVLSVVILNVVASFSLNQKFNLIYNFQFMFKHFFYKYFDYHVWVKFCKYFLMSNLHNLER